MRPLRGTVSATHNPKTSRLRIVEEDVELLLLAEEFSGGVADGLEAREVQLEEDGLLVRERLEVLDSLLGFLFIPRSEVDFRIVFEQCLMPPWSP